MTQEVMSAAADPKPSVQQPSKVRVCKPRWVRVAALLFIVLGSLGGWWAILKFASALWRAATS